MMIFTVSYKILKNHAEIILNNSEDIHPHPFGFIVLKRPVGSLTRSVSWSRFQSSLCLWCYHRCLRVTKYREKS